MNTYAETRNTIAKNLVEQVAPEFKQRALVVLQRCLDYNYNKSTDCFVDFVQFGENYFNEGNKIGSGDKARSFWILGRKLIDVYLLKRDNQFVPVSVIKDGRLVITFAKTEEQLLS